MSSEKPNFLSQPVVKNIFMYRNGDPYYDARRIVINEKRVCNFETLLREVTGGIQAPFGAVRNIYTPRGGHKVDSLGSLQSGEQYVAAGKERFKKLDYLQIGSRKKRMMQTLPVQARPVPQNRIIVSARFLKPIKEPCAIFVVANGDTLNPAIRLLIHQRMLGQFERILEMITEKMGLRVLGGVRSLFTYEGQQVTDGNFLESGQLYVAVGRDKFKKLPYSDLLFTRPRGTRRVKGMKAYSLPPLYRYSKQGENNKSMVRCSDNGDGDSKASPPSHNGNSKENLSSIVREISQARLLSFRKRKSGQSLALGTSDNDDPVSKADDENTDGKSPQEQKSEEKPSANADVKAAEEKDEEAGQKEEPASKNTTEEDTTASKDDKAEDQKTNGEKEEENKELSDQNDDKKEAAALNEGKVEDVKEDVKEEVTGEGKREVKSETQGTHSANSDKTQDNKEKGDGSHSSSEAEIEPDKDKDEDKQDEDGGNKEKSSNDHINDVDTGEEQKETENSSTDKTQTDNETTERENTASSNSNSNQEEDVRKITEEAAIESGEESKVNGEAKGDDDQVESKAEPEKKNLDSSKDATANGEKGKDAEEVSQDKSRKEE